MITDERLITAIQVTTGEVNEGKYLATLVDKTKKNSIEVSEILDNVDSSSKESLPYLEREEITAGTPLNSIMLNDGKEKQKVFEYTKNARRMKFPADHLSVRKARNSNSPFLY